MKSIVYIDDEPLLCEVIAQILEGCGAEVLTFTDPVEAVQYINENRPSLVICDYRMPGMDGLQVLAQIKVDVPFAIISGYMVIEGARDERVTAVLRKPIHPEDLLEFVSRFID